MNTNEKVQQNTEVHKYDVFYIDLGTTRNGSIQHGNRPCMVVGNNVGNKYAPILLVVPITTRKKKFLPTHVKVDKEDGLPFDSTILCEQIMTISKEQLGEKICSLKNKRELIDRKLLVSLGIVDNKKGEI